MAPTPEPPGPSQSPTPAPSRGLRRGWARAAGAGLCVGVLTAFALVGTALVASTLSAQERALWQALMAERWPLLLLPALALAGACAWIAGFLHRRLVAAPAQLAEQARAVLHASAPLPGPTASWPADIRHLAHTVQALAAQRDHLRADMAREVAQSSRSTELERNRLAALMSELSYSVVVCNLDGRILLYNRRAHLQLRALWAAASPLGGAELVGLGRSIYTAFSRQSIAQGLERLQVRLQRGADQPTVEWMAATPSGRSLRVLMAPVRAVEGDVAVPPAGEGGHTASEPGTPQVQINGYVLMLQDSVDAPSQAPVGAHVEDCEQPAFATGGGATRAAPGDSRPVYYDFDLFAHRETGLALEDRRLADLSFTVFDTETTGLDPGGGDEIIQIAALRLVNGRLLRSERFEQLIDPRRPVPAASVPFHGLTSERLQGQPTIEQVLPAFHRFAHDTVLVAHNAAFDMRFLQEKQALTGLRFDQPVLDTLLLSSVLHPNQDSHRLEAMAERLGVPVIGRHTAMGDTLVTAELFLRLLPLLADQGIHTLGQALAAAQRSRYARLRY